MKTTQETAMETGLATSSMIPAAALLALLSASCCVLPIGLSIIGFGGSWLVMLEPFITYRSAVLATVAFLLR